MTMGCCSPSTGRALSVREADETIRDAITPAGAVRVPLARAAGEILRESILADRPFPPYDRVCMDGIALAYRTWSDGGRVFPIRGMQRAGEPARVLDDPASCFEVMTGAVLPEGCDCVIPVEQIVLESGSARVNAEITPERLQFIHRCGSDVSAGAVLVEEGRTLRAPQIALAAAVGQAEVLVSMRPRIALVATGDEVIPVDRKPAPYQIRRSNPAAARAALAGAGFLDVTETHAPDQPDRLASVLGEALDGHDVVVLFGGVSVGRFDLVPDTLTGLGVRRRLHGVRQRPGRPMWFGTGPAGQLVFGLPGNPNSTLVCLYRYVLPALGAHVGAPAGAPAPASLTRSIRFEPTLTLFQPVRIADNDGHGTCRTEPVTVQGSGDAAGLASSDGVLELPAESSTFPPGGGYPFWRWDRPEAARGFPTVSAGNRTEGEA